MPGKCLDTLDNIVSNKAHNTEIDSTYLLGKDWIGILWVPSIYLEFF